MQEFVKKLIERLEGESYLTTNDDGETNKFSVQVVEWKDIKKIVNQLAEEYKNDFCEWNYSTFDEDLIRPYNHKDSVGMYKQCLKSRPFCSCCGKKIKVVE